MSRGQTGTGIQELFFHVLVANSNPREQCDTKPVYCPTRPVCRKIQARRRGETCSQQRLAREHRILLPSAPTRRLLSRNRMRKRVMSRSELDPACTWLSLARGRPGKIGTGADFKCLEIQSTRDVTSLQAERTPRSQSLNVLEQGSANHNPGLDQIEFSACLCK